MKHLRLLTMCILAMGFAITSAQAALPMISTNADAVLKDKETAIATAKTDAEIASKDATAAAEQAKKAAADAQIPFNDFPVNSKVGKARAAADANEIAAEKAKARADACADNDATQVACKLKAYDAELDAYTLETKNRNIVKSGYLRLAKVGIPNQATAARRALDVSVRNLKKAKASAETSQQAAATAETEAQARHVAPDDAVMKARKAEAAKNIEDAKTLVTQGDSQKLITSMPPLYTQATARYKAAAAVYDKIEFAYKNMPAAPK